uniref:Uncharacterized protein n=1 Tax=Escherichia phage fEgEco12 TaxID=3158837 RepID=A0AAU7PHU6_9CAUD
MYLLYKYSVLKTIFKKVLALYLESSIMFYIERGNGSPWQ